MKDCRGFCLGVTLLVAAQLLTAQSRPLSGADASELAAGKRIFDAQCAWCHGTDGTGGAGPSLQRSDLRHASTDAELTSILKNGIAGTEMPGFQWSLTDTMAWRTAAYVRSLGRRPAEQVPGDPTRGAAIYEARSSPSRMYQRARDARCGCFGSPTSRSNSALLMARPQHS